MRFLTRSEWQFCGRWLLATSIAIALCASLGPVGLLVGPILLAIAQGYVLKRYWLRFKAWGIATLVGGYLAIGAFIGLFFSASFLPLAPMVFLSGLPLGATQAYVLRRDGRSWQLWPLVSALVLTISLYQFMPLAVGAAIVGTRRPFWEWMLLAALAGLIGGFLKGVALAWILKPGTT